MAESAPSPPKDLVAAAAATIFTTNLGLGELKARLSEASWDRRVQCRWAVATAKLIDVRPLD